MINYKGTPLFGEDSNPSHTSEFFAIAGTILFWLLFTIFSFVIKPQPKKPEYKEVQIVLSSTPVIQKNEEAPAPAEAASDSSSSVTETQKIQEPAAPAIEAAKESPTRAKSEPVSEPLVTKSETTAKQKSATTSKPKTETKPAAKTTASKPASVQQPAEPIEYALDPMEAFAQQTKQQPKKEFDWSVFDEEDSVINASSSNTQKIVAGGASTFSGDAGKAAADPTEKITSSTSQSNNSKEASSSTASALAGIKNSTFKGNALNGVHSESSVKTKNSGSGKVEMEMSNGRSRALISPASPVINLSPQAAATIDVSKTVTINFKVLEEGNVTEIKITPESILAEIVRNEIVAQISKWLFETADYTATASFEYKIVKQ